MLNTRQAAAALGITARGVRMLISKGLLPARKFGRDWAIELADLERARVRPGPGRPKRGMK